MALKGTNKRFEERLKRGITPTDGLNAIFATAAGLRGDVHPG